MKCLILHQCELSNIGGVESYYNAIIKEFLKLKIEFDIKIIKPPENLSKFKLFFKPYFYVKKIEAELDNCKKSYDFIITRHPYFTVSAKKKFKNTKVIYIPPGNIYETIKFNYKNGKYSFKEKIFANIWGVFLKKYQNLALKTSDLINYFSNSSFTWIDPNKKFIYKSIVNPPGVCKEFKFSKKKISNLILFVGRFIAAKNCSMILRIAKKNKKNIFVLVGNGVEKNHIEKMILKNNIDNVIIESPQKALYYMTYSSILLLTSVRESFGHVIIEAFYNGMPVLGLKPDDKTIINSNKELLISHFGETFSDESKAIELIDEYKRISENHRLLIRENAINKFNMNFHVRKLIDIIKKNL